MRERWKELWKESERVREIVGSNGIKPPILARFSMTTSVLCCVSKSPCLKVRVKFDYNKCQTGRDTNGSPMANTFLLCCVLVWGQTSCSLASLWGRLVLSASLQSSGVSEIERFLQVHVCMAKIFWFSLVVWFHPSWNTGQGVQCICEFVGVETSKHREAKNVRRSSRTVTQAVSDLLWSTQQESTRWDPKDGELCLCRLKPGEILVEDRSDTDVQIVRLTWV